MQQAKRLRAPSLAKRGRVGEGANRCRPQYRFSHYSQRVRGGSHSCNAIANDSGHLANLWTARSFAFAASSSRFFAGAFVSSERRSLVQTAAMSWTAAWNAASLSFDGLLKPLTLRTNCKEA